MHEYFSGSSGGEEKKVVFLYIEASNYGNHEIEFDRRQWIFVYLMGFFSWVSLEKIASSTFPPHPTLQIKGELRWSSSFDL